MSVNRLNRGQTFPESTMAEKKNSPLAPGVQFTGRSSEKFGGRGRGWSERSIFNGRACLEFFFWFCMTPVHNPTLSLFIFLSYNHSLSLSPSHTHNPSSSLSLPPSPNFWDVTGVHFKFFWFSSWVWASWTKYHKVLFSVPRFYQIKIKWKHFLTESSLTEWKIKTFSGVPFCLSNLSSFSCFKSDCHWKKGMKIFYKFII
jgi:hypothetical protein